MLFCLFSTSSCRSARVRDELVPFEGRVTKISDGDSFVVERSAEHVRVRVFGIDAPESDQAFGASSKRRSQELLSGRRVRVLPKYFDAYHRYVAEALIDGSTDLGLTLVSEGMAWVSREHTDDPRLLAAEAEARSKKLGLWGGDDPIAPWEYRKAKKRRK